MYVMTLLNRFLQGQSVSLSKFGCLRKGSLVISCEGDFCQISDTLLLGVSYLS